MKSSIRKNSSEIIKDVKGVVFFNPEYKPRYTTVQSWEKAGKPASCFVYDGVHQLLSAGISIVDAVEIEGRWVRTPLPAVIPPTHYRKHQLPPRKRIKASSVELHTVPFITAVDAARRKIRK